MCLIFSTCQENILGARNFHNLVFVKISKISVSREFLTIWYTGQFCIEITDYSVVHLITSLHSKHCIAELPLKGGAHTCFVDSLDIHTSMEFQLYGALNVMMRSKYAME